MFVAWQWKRMNGFRMINRVSSTILVGRHLYCMSNCSVSPICDSYNYRPSDKTCQLNTQHTGSGLVLVTRRVSSTHTTPNTLVVDLSFWQDVPAQHTLHSARRRLVRHCCRQCVGLVAPHFHRRRLNYSQQTYTHNKHCTVLLWRYYVYRVNTCTHHHSNDQIRTFNPLKASCVKCYTLPSRSNLPFLISDIRALWRSALSARVPECQKLKMVS